MILGQRIRLEPNNAQRTWMERCAGAARFTYNWGLARWREQHAMGEKPNWRKLNAEINARKNDDLAWLRELPWAVPTRAIRDLNAAFVNFFRRVKLGEKPGYPSFKSKKQTAPSFGIEARALSFDGRRVKLPKLGWVRVRQELRFPGKILSARFTKHAGNWYVSIQVEVAAFWVYPHRCESQAVVGVDLGVVDLAVLSTGEHIGASKALRRLEGRLRRLNKELHRRTKGGKNRRKTQAKLSHLHERIANIRNNAAHELTAQVVQRFRWIGVEDLHIQGMLRNRRLAKSVTDAAMGEVLRQLSYKAPLAGSTVVKADRWFPSSKTCSACGLVLDTLPLGVRRWTCKCGAEHDRDENAAKNLEMIAAQAMTACRQGSAGRPMPSVKLPLGQESSSYVNR